MSIEKKIGYYIPTCDVCGETLDFENSFDDACRAASYEGWKRVKNHGYWELACPSCQGV